MKIRWWVPLVAIVAAWLLTILAPYCPGGELEGQTFDDPYADAVVAVSGKTGDSLFLYVLPIQPDSALVARAWAHDLECTGLSASPGSTLDEVTFLVMPAGSITVDGHAVWGYHFTSGMTLLDSAIVNDFWTIAHELMHQLLQGPPPWQGGPHPWWPFAFPCELMSGQHSPAGMIMGGSRPPVKP